MKLPDPPVMVITDRQLAPGSLCKRLVASAKGGCRWVMVREKDLKGAELKALVQEVCAELAPWDVKVFVNGAFDLVPELGLAGAHLPQGVPISDAREAVGQGALLGVSVHDEAELRFAELQGVDYVTLSPLFLSTSKGLHRTPIGLEAFRSLAKSSSIPVIALGGVRKERLSLCKSAGAAGIALLGPIMASENPENTTREVIEVWGSS